MPWKLRKKSNGKYAVVKKDSGKTVAGNKTDLSREQALKTMKAMYANAK